MVTQLLTFGLSSIYANFKIWKIQAKERIRELERQLEALQQKLLDQEDKTNKAYLHLYAQEHDGASTSTSTPSCSKKFNVPELMHQLQVTQDELDNIKVSFLRENFCRW